MNFSIVGGIKAPLLMPIDHILSNPHEYIFKLSINPSEKSPDGVLIPSGAPETVPRISFLGPGGATEWITVKTGVDPGRVYEFSGIARDVGKVNGVKLTATGSDWFPSAVSVDGSVMSNAKLVKSGEILTLRKQ